MPLLFSQLCDLFSALEDVSRRDPPLSPARRQQRTKDIVVSWFKAHKVSIGSPDADAVALLSALFPAKRSDRVYNVQPPRLTRLLRSCLHLGSGRWRQLHQWEKPGQGDLGDCVERVLRIAEFPSQPLKNEVTLSQVDAAFATLAARCRFSAPKARDLQTTNDAEMTGTLENVYQRLQSREAKWFTRLILKDFSCLELNESMVYAIIDPRLPVAMRMYDDFEAAVTELKTLLASQTADAGHGDWAQKLTNDTHLLVPKIGVKIGPPQWLKAKGGVKHAVTIIDGRRMSIERKHDGEYCQIHVNLDKGEKCLQIFSKSGKDSTIDRTGVHDAIRDCLRIGKNNCGFSRKCILEGELLIWSERTKQILPFHKIRKHVSRSGSFLGTQLDSQPHHWEHLMIMFYDVMLIDDEAILHQPYTCRRRLLKTLVTPKEGRADIVWQRYTRFSQPEGPKQLKESLAYAFVRRWEGLVLKPADESYFDLGKPVKGQYPSRCIKLKKDCIKGLGDSADFAVIGAGYDASKAIKYKDMKLSWTHFHIGCLQNKDEVLRSEAKPFIVVFDAVSDCIKMEDLKALNQHGQFYKLPSNSAEASALFDLEMSSGLSRMSVIFRKPFVFDVAGSGFDKLPNRDIFTLRFPRVLRIHWDRDWKEAVSLVELQRMATDAMTVPDRDLENEEADWIEKLDRIDRGERQMMVWDDSQNDEDDEVLFLDTAAAPSVASAPKSSRRGLTPIAPPMVRMDTREMTDKEKRLSTGEVVEIPVSKYSKAASTTTGLYPTPPTSSDRGSSCSTTDSSRPHDMFAKKRSAESVESIEDARRLKEHRSQPDEQSKSNTFPAEALSPLSLRKALRRVTNSARPILKKYATEPLKQTRYSCTDGLLVTKIAVGSDAHVRHYDRTRAKVVMEPSSPNRETTASESSSATTSQEIVSRDTAPGPPMPENEKIQEAPPHPTPTSTATASANIRLPNLQQSTIILSPSLIKKSHPIGDILRSHSLPSFPLPENPSPSHFAFVTGYRPATDILILIESDQPAESGHYLYSLLEAVPEWHPRSVTMWDWRVLSAMTESGLERVNAEQCFVARLVWMPEEGEQGAVEVHWRDGERAWSVPRQV